MEVEVLLELSLPSTGSTMESELIFVIFVKFLVTVFREFKHLLLSNLFFPASSTMNSVADLGIGTNTNAAGLLGVQPDWSLASNANTYTVRKLKVYAFTNNVAVSLPSDHLVYTFIR